MIRKPACLAFYEETWTEQSGEWFQVFASCTFTFRQYNHELTEFDLFKKTSERLSMDVCIAVCTYCTSTWLNCTVLPWKRLNYNTVMLCNCIHFVGIIGLEQPNQASNKIAQCVMNNMYVWIQDIQYEDFWLQWGTLRFHSLPLDELCSYCFEQG